MIPRLETDFLKFIAESNLYPPISSHSLIRVCGNSRVSPLEWILDASSDPILRIDTSMKEVKAASLEIKKKEGSIFNLKA